MFESLQQILGQNVDGYFWLIILISGILFSNFELNQNNIKIKMSLIYILFFVLALFDILDLKIIIPLFIIITFIFQEFIFIDGFKKSIIKKITYLILDYFYQIVFEYKVLYFFLSLLLISNSFYQLVSTNPIFFILVILEIFIIIFINNFKKIKLKYKILYNLILILLALLSFTKLNLFNVNTLNIINIISAITILSNGIIKSLNNEFKTLNFDEIYKKMQKIMLFSNFGCNDKLYDFANLLISKEDRSYFIRRNSYNWLSMEFLIYRLKRVYIKCSENHLSQIKFLGKVNNILLFLLNIVKEIINLCYKLLRKTFKIIFKVLLCGNNIRYYMRGYSTIEMQLIRTLAVVHGYSDHAIQRKFYEIIYSKIFFSSLKSFFAYHQYGNMSQYKYYLIYLYIRVAPVRINKRNYSSILILYDKEEINQISIEEFYIWTLGLSHHTIDETIINNNGIIEQYNMNCKKLKRLIKKYSNG